ncbi:MAG TPA: hypothetical protein VNT26_00340, partial [Candidatus Sulfotelmatobacter sp.]|nr:hypothetical protein [Candidatus Sulfotelmatobacter sp.]
MKNKGNAFYDFSLLPHYSDLAIAPSRETADGLKLLKPITSDACLSRRDGNTGAISRLNQETRKRGAQ